MTETAPEAPTHRLQRVNRSGPYGPDGVPDDGWPSAYGELRARVLRAWESDERMAAPVRVPSGEIPGRDALSAYVMEIAAHIWTPPDGPREGRPFAAAVTAPEGADAYGRMAAWPGRRPLSPTT